MQTLPKTPDGRDQEKQTDAETKKDKPGRGRSYYYDDAYGYEDYQPEKNKRGAEEEGHSQQKD